jgi:hypothetical protein
MDRCKLYLPAHEQVTNYVLLCDQVTYKMYLLTKLSDLIKDSEIRSLYGWLGLVY